MPYGLGNRPVVATKVTLCQGREGPLLAGAALRDHLPDHLTSLGQAAGQVAAVAAELGISLPELAVRSAAAGSEAEVTLFGTTSHDEVAQNVRALEAGAVPREAVEAIRRVELADESLLNPANWYPTT